MVFSDSNRKRDISAKFELVTSKLYLAGLCLLFVVVGCSSDADNTSSTPGPTFDNPTEWRIELVSHLPMSDGLADVWGYVDANGREFALVGIGFGTTTDGVRIVEVTNPQNPEIVASVLSVPGFDVKTWQNYMYTVNGGGSGDGGIVDLSDPTSPVVVGSFPSAHNIYIADGYMYLEFPGLRIMDLNDNPGSPRVVWRDEKFGHDATVVDDRLYDFRGNDGTRIYDVADPTQPLLRGRIQAPFIRFHHSGWPTRDHRYLFIADEGARGTNADITAWDISDLQNPEFVSDYTDTLATVHNFYIIDNMAFVSYYSSGFRIFDVSNPEQGFAVVDEFDTSDKTSENFVGAFGVYPFLPSGNILVSDIEKGLYVFRLVPKSPAQTNLLASD